MRLSQFYIALGVGSRYIRASLNCAKYVTSLEGKMATIRRRGNRYQVQVRKAGHVPISKSFPTRADAKKWATRVEASIDGGQLVYANRTTTVGDLVDTYVRETGEPKRSKRSCFNTIIRLLGRRRIAQITVRDFLSFAAQRASEGAGPATVQMDFSFIGSVLRHGGAIMEVDVSNALSALTGAKKILHHSGKIAKPIERTRRPSDEELARLLRFWASNRRPRLLPMRDIVLFAIATGMRLSEITNLRWADLDENQRTIWIRDRKHPRKKSGNDQQVPLIRGHAVVCGEAIDPQGIILGQSGKSDRIFPYKAESISTAFTRAVASLGIEDLRFHDLRHDATSRLFEAGYSIEQVALCTGHADWNMLRRYTQIKAVSLHRDDSS